MSDFEHDTTQEATATSDGSADDSADASTVVEVPTDAGTVRIGIPPNADDDEVAALVAAVTSRMTEEMSTDDRDDAVANPWRLAARLGVRRRIELPRECRRGGEWMAAARRP